MGSFMEENIKSRIILVLSILTLIFFVGCLKSCGNAYRQKQGRDREMATRLDLEEKINKISQEKSTLEEKFLAAEKQEHEDKLELQQLKKALVQEQLISQSLKEELNKVSSLKETLEEDLKDALVEGGKTNKPNKKR